MGAQNKVNCGVNHCEETCLCVTIGKVTPNHIMPLVIVAPSLGHESCQGMQHIMAIANFVDMPLWHMLHFLSYVVHSVLYNTLLKPTLFQINDVVGHTLTHVIRKSLPLLKINYIDLLEILWILWILQETMYFVHSPRNKDVNFEF